MRLILILIFLSFSTYADDGRYKNFCGRGFQISIQLVGQLPFTDYCSKVDTERLKRVKEMRFFGLMEIRPEWIEGLEHLEELDLAFWMIDEIYETPPGLLDNMINLKNLELSLFPVEVYNRSNFKNLSKLETLSLSSCEKPIKMDEDTLYDLKNLKVLNFEYLCLESLPKSLLKNNPKLETVIFRKMSLLEIPDNFFKGLKNLKKIDLSGNFFDSFDRERLGIPSSTEVELRPDLVIK
jgi:Leucine-rich repeat (LRR) protein